MFKWKGEYGIQKVGTEASLYTVNKAVVFMQLYAGSN